MPMTRTALALALLCAAAAAPAAERNPFYGATDDVRPGITDPEPWAEAQYQLPPFPTDQDLVEFQVDDPKARFRYFIDGKHLSVGEDGVVRYTLVMQSTQGARNVSVEGLRCDIREVKTYAYGGGRDKIRALRDPQWERIPLSGPYWHHLELRNYYFCDAERKTPFDKEQILQLLAGTRVNRTHDSGMLF